MLPILDTGYVLDTNLCQDILHICAQDGIEKVDAAYEVFLQVGFEDFQQYAFELQTIAVQNLAPERIRAYMKIIHQEGGLPMSQMAMEYVLLVLAKYLQMMVAYSIFKEDQDRVTILFETFNRHFAKLNQVFEEVTGEAFKAGQEITLPSKPVAPVKPVPRNIKPVLQVSNEERRKLQVFLERHQLEELTDVFQREGVTLNDVLSMNDDDMKDIGIGTFSLRRSLKMAIRGVTGDSAASSAGDGDERPEVNTRDQHDAPTLPSVPTVEELQPWTDKVTSTTSVQLPASEEPLPPNWSKKTTKQGTYYFINHVAKITTWVDPRGFKEAEGLPEGWEARTLISGKVYYINHLARTTQFERPETE